jgi:hypothetical protein
VREFFRDIGTALGFGPKPPDTDAIALLSAKIQFADNLRAMLESKGWQSMEVMLLKELEDRESELRESEFKALKEVTRLQGRIAALRFVLTLPRTTVDAGETARKELEEVTHG